MMEGVFINVKNRSKTITAELEVPQGGANGTILAQGGRFGGWSLYVKDGVPAYAYNFLGLKQTSIVAGKPLAPGKATVKFDFAYDGGGPGKGGIGTLFVDGEKVAEGRIENTQAACSPRTRPPTSDRPRHAGRRGGRRRGRIEVQGPHPEGDGGSSIVALCCAPPLTPAGAPLRNQTVLDSRPVFDLEAGDLREVAEVVAGGR